MWLSIVRSHMPPLSEPPLLLRTVVNWISASSEPHHRRRASTYQLGKYAIPSPWYFKKYFRLPLPLLQILSKRLREIWYFYSQEILLSFIYLWLPHHDHPRWSSKFINEAGSEAVWEKYAESPVLQHWLISPCSSFPRHIDPRITNGGNRILVHDPLGG